MFEPVGNLAISWVNLFKIELSNDEYFEGCGLFKCEADCINSDQEFEMNRGR